MSSGTLVSRGVQTQSAGRNIGLLILRVLTVVAMAVAMWAALLYAKPATNLLGHPRSGLGSSDAGKH